MSADYANEHEHDLDPEYLSAADATTLEISSTDGGLDVDLIVPCPDCSDPLRLSAAVHEVTEADVDLPLDDVADPYD